MELLMDSSTLDWEKLGKVIQAGATVISTAIAIIALWRQQRQAERLKVLEAELSKTEFEHQTKFAKLHEKRAEVISEIYRRVVILEIWLNHVVAETELPDEVFTSPKDFAEGFDAVFGQISLNLQDLAAYFNLNRLYLSEGICQKILHFHDVILHKSDAVHGYFYERFKQMPESEISEIYGKNLRERARRELQQVSDTRRAIENEFRALLGISDNNSSSDNQLSTGNDLMWIPTPDTIDPIKRYNSEQ
jgi:hypothetical protein